MLSLSQLFPAPSASLDLLLPRLAPRQCFHYQAQAGQRLVAQSPVWLTQQGLREDVVLGAGQGWVLEQSGLVVVQGL